MDQTGPLVTVTLDGAQRPLPMGALRAVGRGLTGDVRVVVIRLPDGPLELFDGADLFEDDAAVDPLAWLGRPDLLSIAVLPGPAHGPALHLALACDLRVLTSDATLSMVGADGSASYHGIGALTRLLGPARALELALTGRRVSAADAALLGLATLVVPADELDARVRALVATVVARPRDEVITVKALVRGAGSRSAPEQCDAERAAQVSRLGDPGDTGTGTDTETSTPETQE